MTKKILFAVLGVLGFVLPITILAMGATGIEAYFMIGVLAIEAYLTLPYLQRKLKG